MTDAQLGERVARMETELKYLQRDMADVKGDVADIKAKQDQMLLLLTEARGGWKTARWIWLGLSASGGFVVAYWSSFRTLFTKIGG